MVHGPFVFAVESREQVGEVVGFDFGTGPEVEGDWGDTEFAGTAADSCGILKIGRSFLEHDLPVLLFLVTPLADDIGKGIEPFLGLIDLQLELSEGRLQIGELGPVSASLFPLDPHPNLFSHH